MNEPDEVEDGEISETGDAWLDEMLTLLHPCGGCRE